MTSRHGISVRYVDIDKCVFTPLSNCDKTESVTVHGSTTHETLCNKTLNDPSNNIAANALRSDRAIMHIPPCPGGGYFLESTSDYIGNVMLRWAKSPEGVVKDSLRLQETFEVDLLRRNAELVNMVNSLDARLNEAHLEIIDLKKKMADIALTIGCAGTGETDPESKLNLKTAKKIISENIPYINDAGQVVIPGDISSVLGAAIAILEAKISK